MNPFLDYVSRETLPHENEWHPNRPITLEDTSYLSILVYRQFIRTKGRLIIIGPDENRLSRLIEDVESIDPTIEAMLMEEQHWGGVYSEEHELELISERVEALRLLEKSSRLIVGLSARAVAQKVPPPKDFNHNRVQLISGGTRDFEQFRDQLKELGYRRREMVLMPGEFAIRGGIVDVFSYGHENPIRLEFFGNVVDKMRQFDASTQRSLSDVQSASLFPSFSNGLPGSQVSIFSYLSEGDTVVVINKQLVMDRFEDFVPFGTDQPVAYISPSELNAELTQFKAFQVDFDNGVHDDIQSQLLIISETNFKEKISEIISLGYTVFLGYDQKSQWDRIEDVLRSRSESVVVYPVKPSLHHGFIDHASRTAFISEHQLFRKYRRIDRRHRIHFNYSRLLDDPYQLKAGDYVVHEDHGIGKFLGLTQIKVGNKKTEVAKIEYADKDNLFVNVKKINKIQKYSSGEGVQPTLSKLGSPDWHKKKSQVKKKVVDITRDLLELYQVRRKSSGYSFGPDTAWQSELEASFIFEDTPDQMKSVAEVKRDMEAPYPMDRLLCGDVGFGKTEVAVRAAFKAVQEGKQVAIMVPTTILAQQHFQTFSGRLKPFPVTIDVLSRFRTTAEKTTVKKSLAEGSIDIIIGTHALLSKDLIFNNLGLLVVDEEHRFGVQHKEKIKQIKTNVDVLSMSATPIPRTLQLSMMGARDISMINTPPPNRMPVKVKVVPFDDKQLKAIVNEELRRDGQVYFIHNRVKSIYRFGEYLSFLLPKARIRVAHGQMPGKELEQIMVDFINHEFDLLVATNIIESGVDIPNANTIIINRADRFGLSELYQLKGRVGRANKQGYCYLLTPNTKMLNKDAVKRLMTIERYSDLGSGIHIAMRDLDIRGAGNILGSEQSGFVNTVGFDLYNKLVEEAVIEVKNELNPSQALRSSPTIISQEVLIETGAIVSIPIDYIPNYQERFEFYKKLSSAVKKDQIKIVKEELLDRFGPLPESVEALLLETELRLILQKTGAQKLLLAKGLCKLIFPLTGDEYYESPWFEELLLRTTESPHIYSFQELDNRLVLNIKIEGLDNITSDISRLNHLITNIYPVQILPD